MSSDLPFAATALNAILLLMPEMQSPPSGKNCTEGFACKEVFFVAVAFV